MATEGCRVEVAKPLYDRSDRYLGDKAGDRVVKPDFEGAIHAAHGGFLRSFAVEVMGYDHAEYRAAKARIREAVTGKGTCCLEHLAHDRAKKAEHDRDFGRALARLGRRAIDKAQGLPRHPPAPTQPAAAPRPPDPPVAVPPGEVLLPRPRLPALSTPIPPETTMLLHPARPRPAAEQRAPEPLPDVPRATPEQRPRAATFLLRRIGLRR